jgi:hypothetical protein
MGNIFRKCIIGGGFDGIGEKLFLGFDCIC